MWLLVVPILLIGGAILWLWRLIARAEHSSGDLEAATRSARRAQDWVPVQRLERAQLVLSGKRYRAIVRVAGTNFGLLTPSEQARSVAAWRGVLDAERECQMALYVLSRPLSPQKVTERLRRQMARQTDERLRSYAASVIADVEAHAAAATPFVREYYLVIGWDAPADMPEAMAETEAAGKLDRAAEGAIRALEAVGLAADRLDAGAIAALLHGVFQRDLAAAADLAEAMDAGILQLATTGR